MIPNDPKLSQLVPNSPNWSQNDLSVFKLTSETISIGIVLLLRSFWVVIWLVCDKFEFGVKIRPKWPKIAPNQPQNDQNWFECLKNDYNWFILCIQGIFDCSKVAVLFSSSGEVGTGKKLIFYGCMGPNFSHIKIDPITSLWCSLGQFKEGVCEKNALLCTPISAPKRPFSVPWEAVSGQKHGK